MSQERFDAWSRMSGSAHTMACS